MYQERNSVPTDQLETRWFRIRETHPKNRETTFFSWS